MQNNLIKRKTWLNTHVGILEE